MRSAEEIRSYLLSGTLKFATVSGVWTTRTNLIRYVDENIPAIDIITTKSYQVQPNPGNREPIIGEVAPGSYVNAVGLRNPGMEGGYKELHALLDDKPLRALLNISLSGNSPEDFVTLATKFAPLADILELNFSCPHAKPGYGASIGCSAELVREYMQAIRPVSDVLLFPKLTPNVENIGEIARAAVEAGADGITAINTVGPEPYIEPVSGKLLLYNPNGHKGGRSGEHIFEIAVKKISEIREAVGPDIPIIGMGGVSRGSQIRAIRSAGANVVGIGSVIARVKHKKQKEYFDALKFDAEFHTDSSASFLLVKQLAKYKAYTITEMDFLTKSMLTLTLEGDPMLYKPGQYVFIRIPETGEKPFGIVSSSPLRFIVRKRHYQQEAKKGEFTHALFQMKVGDTLYIRGPYGDQVPENHKNHVVIVSGGTGLALVPKLAEHFASLGHIVKVYHGVKEKKEAAFDELISPHAVYTVVPDEGKAGRVLDILSEELDQLETENCSLYTIGPDELMQKALEIAIDKGCEPENCYASLETNHMCGIGMCGECECGGVISCKNGTFFDYTFLKKHYFKREKR